MAGDLARLRRRSEFLNAARRGRSAALPGMVVQAVRRDQPGARYGLTASKKVGNAVLRNRARRRLRAVAMRCIPSCAAANRDYVLIARRATATRAFGDLLADFEAALKRLGAWQPREEPTC